MKKTKMMMLGFSVIAAVFAGQANADFITPITVSASGVTVIGGFEPIYLLGEALSTAYIQTSTDRMWQGDTSTWSPDPDNAHVYLTFDLGAAYNVSQLYLWSFNHEGPYQEQQKSVKNFTLESSVDGSTFTTVAGFFVELAYVGSTADMAVQTYALTGVTNVRYLKMDITSSWYLGGCTLTQYRVVGLGEVAFEGTKVGTIITVR